MEFDIAEFIDLENTVMKKQDVEETLHLKTESNHQFEPTDIVQGDPMIDSLILSDADK